MIREEKEDKDKAKSTCKGVYDLSQLFRQTDEKIDNRSRYSWTTRSTVTFYK